MSIPAAPWDRLYADIKIVLPGPTDAVIQQEVFRTVKDFMDQTNIWLEDVPITGMPDIVSYPFALEGFGTPNRLMIVFDPALSPPNDQRWIQGGVSMRVPGIIEIMYAPSEQKAWMATIAKNVIDPTDANNYPEIDTEDWWIIDKYRDAFYYGTLARLQAQPTKPYTNPQAAGANYQQYVTQRGKARTDAVKANTYGGQRWMFPQSFATTSRKGWT
jgi:hypothetical protein